MKAKSTKGNHKQDRYTLEEYLRKFFPSTVAERLPKADTPRELGIKLASDALIQLRKSLIDHKPLGKRPRHTKL